MIPITDKHLREACGLAMEQDIAELTTLPCHHCFSEDFHKSMQNMQEETFRKQSAKAFGLRVRPLWRYLPAAAVITLVCLAGYRLLDLMPLRMGSPGPYYNETTGETAGQEYNENLEETDCTETGAGMEDAGGYFMDTEESAETAGNTPFDPEEVPGGIAAEDTAEETAADTDLPKNEETIPEEGVDNNRDEGVLPKTPENQTGASSESSVSKKDSGTVKESLPEQESEEKAVKLLAVTYDDSTRILKLELQNDSDRTILLENNWILFNADGDAVNTETSDPRLSAPACLRPGKTAVICCILSDGNLPDGEYTLELENGEYVLTFTFP